MRTVLVALVALATVAACNRSETVDAAPAVEAGAPFPDQYEGPADILTVTDAGYPMYAVTARVDGYAEPIDMLLNDQGAELNGLDPDALAGQTVSIAVITENRAALLSVTVQGTEVFASQPDLVVPPEAVSITGVLDGAAAPTAGDLPDVVTVTAPDGAPLPLEAFVTPEMAAADGQTVTAVYEVRPMRSITRVAAVAP